MKRDDVIRTGVNFTVASYGVNHLANTAYVAWAKVDYFDNEHETEETTFISTIHDSPTAKEDAFDILKSKIQSLLWTVLTI